MATDPTILTARLAEAETQYHQLMLGQVARVFVDQNGERVEYTATNAGRLMSYIQDLKRQLGELSTGPMNVWL